MQIGRSKKLVCDRPNQGIMQIGRSKKVEMH
jgi:hypothetical protein